MLDSARFRVENIVMKPILIAALASLPILGASPVAHGQEQKIGFVSLERILRDSAPAAAAKKKIEAEFQKRDQEMSRLAEQLKRRQETFEKNGATMSDSERTRNQREIPDLDRDFQRRQREYREDLTQRQNEELSTVIERANRAVRQLAEAEKFDVILQEAVWASPRIDVTDRVIKSLSDSRAAK
jgi:outer membrane protein